MRLRVHHPLFAGFLGLVGLLVALIVLLTGNGLRGQLEELYRTELGRQINLAHALARDTPTTDPDSLARLITELIGNRVTFVDASGVVLGDSYVAASDVGSVENHGRRPEVVGALRGQGVSYAKRTSSTVGQPLLYGARLTRLGNRDLVLRVATPLTEIDRAVDALRRTVAITGLVVMLLALAAAFLMSKAITRPLVALADRAGALARGDFSSKVPASRVAELEDLSRSFNRLTDQLQARIADLGHERDEMQTLIDCMAEGVIAITADAGLLRLNRAARSMLRLTDVATATPLEDWVDDATLRELLERSVTTPVQSREIELNGREMLAASRALDSGGAVTTLLDISELRRLEKVRQDFVANASHELKTPLTSIRGYAETLVDDDPPEQLRRQFLESIRNNTLRLQRLVDDLLDLSKIESGGQTVDVQAVEVSDLAVEAWDAVTEGAPAPTFSLDGSAVALGDPEGIFLIFRNLLENAVRHTGPDGEVAVTVRSDLVSGSVTVSVADDGDGIPGHALPRVFERFYRADAARARDAGGTGLGLAIVKHLVQSMGGDVFAHSSEGFGTRMTFTLPLAS